MASGSRKLRSRQRPSRGHETAGGYAGAGAASRHSHLAGFNPSIHDPLEDSIPFLVRRTASYFRVAVQLALRKYGLGFSHWFFLRALWLEDGITQRELCRRIEAAEPAAVTALGGLERRGYIRRVQDTRNRRRSRIVLTPKGVDLRAELLPYASKLHAWGVRGVSKRDLAIVKSTLNRIRTNMAELLKDDSALEDGRAKRGSAKRSSQPG